MDTTIILSDFQSPYHDPDAVEVALQIAEEVKPNRLILNGDFLDLHTCGRHPVVPSAQVLDDFAEELERSRTLLTKIRRRITARDCRFLSGNHEWRLERLFMRDNQLVRILGEKRIADATSVSALLDLPKLKIKYIGQYPKGTWLYDEHVTPYDKNVHIEHGYKTRIKSGYTSSAVMADRWANSVIGHVERLAIIWKKTAGNRRFFGIEGGNFSRIGEPGKGENIYSGVPFSEPDYMDHQQGFSIIYKDGGQFFPFVVPIHNGRAVWAGRTYRA